MDKKTWQIYIKDRFYLLESFLNEQVKIHIEQRSRLKTLQEKRASGDYSDEYIEREQAKFEGEKRIQNQLAYEKALELIDKLIETMQARQDEPVDLADANLTNALNILNLAGSKLDIGELIKLVDQFTGNPAALKTLKSVFENQDLSFGVKLVDDRLYEPAFIEQVFKENAFYAFLQAGSLNSFATVINKIAQKEGLTFPKEGGLIDPEGATERMFAVAGLK
ncbi:MAG: hypothetical protein ACYC00_23040 [Eubacteriales bacterium]